MGRVIAIVVVLLGAAFVAVQLLRPTPGVRVTSVAVSARLPGAPVTLAWPSEGEAAIGVEGTGVLAAHGTQTETPLASLAKVMAAYVVLRDHPLSATSNGPDITVSATAVAVYQKDRANGDSVVAVQAGERLSELQALEALLIPSGDNIATLLADWDAGSEPAFVAKMNAEARRMGLAHTHYADASGVAPGTVSTATDQLRLAMAAMRVPTFARVVAMAQVTLPVAGLQYNVNSQLGTNGIVGIKTGFTTTAGACFVFAATTTVGARTATVVGAVLHQRATRAHPSALTDAFAASEALLTSADHALERATVVRSGAALGHLAAPWAPPVGLDASRSVTLTGFPGQQVQIKVDVPRRITTPIGGGHRVGTASVGLRGPGSVPPVHLRLVAARSLPSASLGWRLTRL